MTDILCHACRNRIAQRRSDGTALIHHKGLDLRVKVGRVTRNCTAYIYKSTDHRGRPTWGPCEAINVVEVVRVGVGAA